MTISELRRVQMQKFADPQVIDSIRYKPRVFPFTRLAKKRQYSLYNQYFRKNYLGF